jgi:hypothetical protein
VTGVDLADAAFSGGTRPGPVDMFDAAIAKVAELTLALTSANAELAFAEGVQVRGELECALLRAQVLAERLPDDAERAVALGKLADMHAVATRALLIAPAPTVAALEAFEAGDPTAWRQEEQTWIAVRLASGSSPRTAARRERRKTRPDSPKALRDDPDHASEADDASPDASTTAAGPLRSTRNT